MLGHLTLIIECDVVFLYVCGLGVKFIAVHSSSKQQTTGTDSSAMPPKMPQIVESQEYEVVHQHIFIWMPIESYKRQLIDEGVSLDHIELALTEIVTRDPGDGSAQVFVHTSTQMVIHILD